MKFISKAFVVAIFVAFSSDAVFLKTLSYSPYSSLTHINQKGHNLLTSLYRSNYQLPIRNRNRLTSGYPSILPFKINRPVGTVSVSYPYTSLQGNIQQYPLMPFIDAGKNPQVGYLPEKLDNSFLPYSLWQRLAPFLKFSTQYYDSPQESFAQPLYRPQIFSPSYADPDRFPQAYISRFISNEDKINKENITSIKNSSTSIK